MTSPGTVPFVALLAPPLLAALVAPVRAAYPRTLAGLHALLALVPVAAAGWLATLVVAGAVPTWGPSGRPARTGPIRTGPAAASPTP